MDAYAQHVLISAIKYLDGTRPEQTKGQPNGPEDKIIIDAQNIMYDILPPETQFQLVFDRIEFWRTHPDNPRKQVA